MKFGRYQLNITQDDLDEAATREPNGSYAPLIEATGHDNLRGEPVVGRFYQASDAPLDLAQAAKFFHPCLERVMDVIDVPEMILVIAETTGGPSLSSEGARLSEYERLDLMYQLVDLAEKWPDRMPSLYLDQTRIIRRPQGLWIVTAWLHPIDGGTSAQAIVDQFFLAPPFTEIFTSLQGAPAKPELKKRMMVLGGGPSLEPSDKPLIPQQRSSSARGPWLILLIPVIIGVAIAIANAFR